MSLTTGGRAREGHADRPLPISPGALPPAPVIAGAAEERPRRGRFGIARNARTRILLSFVVLLALSALFSTLAIREYHLIRLDDRVADAGQQEVLELEQLLAVGRDPETGVPFTSPKALFNAYLARNVPSSDEALLTFVDGQFHRSIFARFPLDQLPSDQMVDWADLSTRSPGETDRATGEFDTELGNAHYRLRRVVLEEGIGVFVVAVLPAAELEEIQDLQTYGFLATLVVLLLASAIAYPIAGRALSPVRQLTETARSISRSDLTQRIKVYGVGDAADMARSFNAMLDRLESVFQSQRAFVQDASHELRDPITICRGHLELLGDDPGDRQRTIDLVVGELDRMGRMVNNLQLLAEAEQPDFLRREWVDLELFAHELAAKAGVLAPRRWTLEQAAEGVLVADREFLTEAMMNLAHNAVQYTTEDDTIAIGASLTASDVCLWVRDTGTGIPLSDQARIFDRFTRGRNARYHRGGGLGLAIVRTIAEAHGGRIDLDSRVGEGSTFTIVLPRHAGEGATGGQDTDR